jgi:CRP-like cAMP-binding protein
MTCPSAADVKLHVRSRFLEGLSPASLDRILASATPRQYLAGTIVTKQEGPANYYCLLTRGRARYFFVTRDGQKLLLHWLSPGETFGVSALLANQSNYLAGTEMVKDSCVLMWDRRTIRSLFERYPRLLENALLTATDYLTLAINAQLALSCQDARQRLAQVLLNLAHNFGQTVRDGTELEVTNEELAGTTNLTLFTTSRLLGEWQRQGSILKSRGKILLRYPEQLFRAAA